MRWRRRDRGIFCAIDQFRRWPLHSHERNSMKISQTQIIVFLTLVSLAATGVAWQQYWKAQLLQAAAVGMEDNADLRRRLAAAEKRTRELDDVLAVRNESGMGAEDDAAAVTTGNPAGREVNQDRGRGGPRGGFNAIMDRPEMQQLRSLQQKVALDSNYGALFKSLHLSPEQLGKFKTLLAEKESTMMDTMMAAREQGVDPRTDPQGFRKLVTAAQAAFNSEIEAVIGSDGLAQYEQFQQTQPQRAIVDQLQQSLSYTSEPLTAAQAAQMIQILAATTPQTDPGIARSPDGGAPPGPPGGFGGGGVGPGGGRGGGGVVITAAAVAQAQTVLSPTQQQALLQLQQVQTAQQQVQQLMRDSGMSRPPGDGGGQSQSGGRNPGGG
jgi:hypothetical protein